MRLGKKLGCKLWKWELLQLVTIGECLVNLVSLGKVQVDWRVTMLFSEWIER